MRVYNKHSYTQEQQAAIVRQAFPGQDADKLIELFRKAWPNKCLTDVIEIKGRMGFRLGTIEYSDLRAASCSAPTYTYVFAHDFPQEGGRGAWHCADIPLVFRNSAMYSENFNSGVIGGLEDIMCACWVNFARFSDPNNETLGIRWPEYKTGECATMIFDDVCEVRYDFDRELTYLRESMQLKILEEYSKFSQTVN